MNEEKASNENKMSDGGQERALIGVKVWKSSQKWSAQRSAVRSIGWLGVWTALEHDIDGVIEPCRRLQVPPTQTCIELLLIQREQVKNRKAHVPSLLFQRVAKSRPHSATPMVPPNEHAAEPGCELLVAGQIVLAQSAHTEQLPLGRRDKSEREAVGVHV